MHTTAMKNADMFFKTYMGPDYQGKVIVEIGSQDVNGSIRSVAPAGNDYIGIDFVEGPGVDLVLKNPYKLPLEDNSVDCFVSSSVFEHSEMFWLLFIEIIRVLKPNGLFYMNVPSNGPFHRYPVDCWRFYPDSGAALAKWARMCEYNTVLLESYVSYQEVDAWNDFVGVFIKDEAFVSQFPKRIVHTHGHFYNGMEHGVNSFINPKESTEDQQRLHAIHAIVNRQVAMG
ncbi:MAG: methyltransferase type 11 [Leptothrix sp. (in: Bacteria)]|nr:methyltransferase type 11 [Leptothrix sp. (in: b-proteobacteria)]